jgi:polysaccharide biosynthesis protein PslH
MNCLWISRDLPFPLDAGDKIYSANLARSLADSGARLRFIGFPGPEAAPPPADWPIEWLSVGGAKRNRLSAMLSARPVQASQHATRAYRELLDRQLQEPWDAVIFDSYGSGWALRPFLARANTGQHKRPLPVYVSHNHEESVWRSMASRAQGSPVRKLALWQNYIKARVLERALTKHVGLITTITEEDASAYRAQAPQRPTVTLTPGYKGWSAPPRVIDAQTPRRVVIVGSFRWLPKQENLRRFIEQADAIFAQHAITLEVIGEVPAELRAELTRQTRATEFHGFVDDIGRHFAQARMALVPELIGGGFKLKFLDYMFGRVPIAAIGAAANGLPRAAREHVLTRDDLPSLTMAIVDKIDDFDALNRMQRGAYAAAEGEFRWSDRGLKLREAITRTRQ